LVHEAFLRLHRQRRIDWRNRGHFFALSATLMRRILIDHARHRGVVRRHAQAPPSDACGASEPDGAPPASVVPFDLIALDDALNRLSRMAPELSRVVELRFFAGLTFAEAGAVLGVTDRTVKRRWQAARLWLFRCLQEGTVQASTLQESTLQEGTVDAA
ncbi:MAG: ECF-type sigma factor, partial [Acidobacteriota bacterium]